MEFFIMISEIFVIAIIWNKFKAKEKEKQENKQKAAEEIKREQDLAIKLAQEERRKKEEVERKLKEENEKLEKEKQKEIESQKKKEFEKKKLEDEKKRKELEKKKKQQEAIKKKEMEKKNAEKLKQKIGLYKQELAKQFLKYPYLIVLYNTIIERTEKVINQEISTFSTSSSNKSNLNVKNAITDFIFEFSFHAKDIVYMQFDNLAVIKKFFYKVDSYKNFTDYVFYKKNMLNDKKLEQGIVNYLQNNLENDIVIEWKNDIKEQIIEMFGYEKEKMNNEIKDYEIRLKKLIKDKNRKETELKEHHYSSNTYLSSRVRDMNSDILRRQVNLEQDKLTYKELTEKKYYEENIYKLSISLCFYSAYLFNYALNISNLVNKFNENKDLEKMYTNLKNTINDYEYIKNKLYPMYKASYKDTFREVISENKFFIIILLDRTECTNFDKIENYKLSNGRLKASITNIILNYLQYNDNSDYINNIMLVVAKIEQQEKLNVEMNYETLFNILTNLENIFKDVNKKIFDKELENEKKRLLNGDLSKEIELQKLALDFSNLKNGYEFEEYVANLYKKLGYKIEEVTKKSGDQGADVIAWKNKEKYVIQAKFYNSPVGNKAVQEVVASLGMYKANKGIVVTNNTFTISAIELAKANNIELIDGEKIEEFKKEIINKL